MLLLVIDAELDQRRGVLRQTVVEQTLQRLVHMSAVGAHLGRGRARQQSTLGPRMPRPHALIVGVKTILEGLVEPPVGGQEAWQHERLEEPCLLYTSPSPRDGLLSRMPSSA